MDYSAIAQDILTNVGGEGNIKKMFHCVTRLRLELKDPGLFNEEALKEIQTVQGTAVKGNQYQIVLGGKVVPIFDQLKKTLHLSDSDESEAGDVTQDMTVPARILDYIAGTIQPVVPVIFGAGIVQSLMALLNYLNILSPHSTTYQLLTIIGASGFYFLPVVLAVSGARKLGCNPYLTAMIAGVLIHPDFIKLVSAGNPITFLGIPVSGQSYASTITPMLLVVPAIYFIEKFANRISPDMLKSVLIPAITLLISAPVALIILAPIANILSGWIAIGIQFIFAKLSIVGGMIIGGVAPFLVLTGLHNAVALPIIMDELAKNHYSLFYPLLAFSNISVAGASFGVALKSKNKAFRGNAFSAAFTGAVGITEPALFGVLLYVRRPFIAVGITSAIFGALALLFKVKAIGLGLCGLGGLPVFFGDTFVYYVILGLGSFILSAILTYIIGFKDIPEKKQAGKQN